MNNEYILEVKKKRLLFIDEFEKNIENIYDELIKAQNDNQPVSYTHLTLPTI